MTERPGPSNEGHREVGRATAGTVDWLVVVGDGAEGIAEGAIAGGMDPSRVIRVQDAEGALEVVPHRVRGGDVVLLKASRGIGLDRVVDGLSSQLGDRAER